MPDPACLNTASGVAVPREPDEAEAEASPLRLSAASLVVPCASGLRIVHRGGRYLLGGDAIADIHARVSPYLDGRYTEKELMRAVPSSQRKALRGYLDRLREAGALVPPTGPPSLPTAVALHAIDDDVLPSRVVAHRVAFAQDPGRDVWLLRAASPEDVLVRLDDLFDRSRPLVLILVRDEATNNREAATSMREGDASNGRHTESDTTAFLLRYAETVADASAQSQNALYVVDPRRRRTRCLFANAHEADEAPIYDQLELVAPATDRLQVPFLFAEATHDLLDAHALGVALDRAGAEAMALDTLTLRLLRRRPRGWTAGEQALRNGSVNSNRKLARLRAFERAAFRKTTAARDGVPTSASRVADPLTACACDATGHYLAGALDASAAPASVWYHRGFAGMHVYWLDDPKAAQRAPVAVYSHWHPVAQQAVLAMMFLHRQTPTLSVEAERVVPMLQHRFLNHRPGKETLDDTVRALEDAMAPYDLQHDAAPLWGHTLHAVTVDTPASRFRR